MNDKEYKSKKHYTVDEYKRDVARVEFSNSYSKYNCNIMPDIEDYEYYENPIDLYLISMYGIDYANAHPLKSGVYKKGTVKNK
jgi:hypothetical protein